MGTIKFQCQVGTHKHPKEKTMLNLSTIFVVDVKVVLYLLVSRDSSLCFSHLASWACFANVVVGYLGNVWSVVCHLVSRFLFPIRNLVTKCDLRCLVRTGLHYL